MVQQPHYLLICDSIISSPATVNNELIPSLGLGRWHFVLEQMDGSERLEAADCESYIHQDRLALLVVVRGLEALEQSSLVRLVTTSRYVDRGLRFGLPNWRETNYQWESFGERKPVRNADLWRRVDVAMQYHKVTCRLLKGHVHVAEPERAEAQEFMEPQTVAASSPMSTSSAPTPELESAMVASANTSTRVAVPFAPPKIAYRMDAPHRNNLHRHNLNRNQSDRRHSQEASTLLHFRAARSASLPNPHYLQIPKAASPANRLQWWEMAARLDNLASFVQSTCELADQTRVSLRESAFT